MITLSAVLLAGGESRRMGRDKATIEFRCAPLWQRQLEVLRNLDPQTIFVSCRVKPNWLPADVELLLDKPPSRGPLSGLTQSIEQIQTSHLIALALDLPFLTSDHLRWLSGFAVPGLGVVPLLDGKIEPLVAVYPKEAGPFLTEALGGSDFSMQRVVRNLATAGKVQMLEMSPEARSLYRNINSPEDLRLQGFEWAG